MKSRMVSIKFTLQFLSTNNQMKLMWKCSNPIITLRHVLFHFVRIALQFRSFKHFQECSIQPH